MLCYAVCSFSIFTPWLNCLQFNICTANVFMRFDVRTAYDVRAFVCIYSCVCACVFVRSCVCDDLLDKLNSQKQFSFVIVKPLIYLATFCFSLFYCCFQLSPFFHVIKPIVIVVVSLFFLQRFVCFFPLIELNLTPQKK